MDQGTRNQVAEALERLANLPSWNDEVCQRCHDIVQAHLDNELCAYAYDDLVHCSAVTLVFHSHLYPSKTPEMKEYQRKFRAIAEGLRAGMTLEQVKRGSGI